MLFKLAPTPVDIVSCISKVIDDEQNCQISDIKLNYKSILMNFLLFPEQFQLISIKSDSLNYETSFETSFLLH